MLIALLAVAALVGEQGQPSNAPVIVDPEWTARPSPSYPRGAVDMNIVNGEVVASCTADDAGRLADCAVESESPQGFGFAREVLVSARIARLDTRAEDFVPGARVRFTTRFKGIMPEVVSRDDE